MKLLVKKLRQLQSVTPTKDWKSANRAFLMSEIAQIQQAQDTPQQVGAFTVVPDFIKSTLSFIVPNQRTLHLLKPAGVLFSISLFVLTSGIFSVSASQSTVPGDVLYKLKIATENVQKALTVNNQDKALLDITFAGKRINELEKIVKNTSGSEDEKNEKVTAVMDIFQKNISSAQQTLAVTKDSNEVNKIVALAGKIDKKIGEYVVSLGEITVGASDVVKDVVEGAKTTAETTGDEALSVIVEKHEDGSASSDGEGIVLKFDGRLDDLKKSAEMLDAELEYVLINVTTDSAYKLNSIREDIRRLMTQIDEVVATFPEIETLVDEGKFSDPLIILNEEKAKLKSIATSLDTLIEKYNGVLPAEESSTHDIPITATSTDSVLDDSSAEGIVESSV